MAGELVCCRFCGRDTRALSGICARCYDSRFDRRGEIGRRIRSSDHYYSPFEDAEESPETSFERYHGETVRDDL